MSLAFDSFLVRLFDLLFLPIPSNRARENGIAEIGVRIFQPWKFVKTLILEEACGEYLRIAFAKDTKYLRLFISSILHSVCQIFLHNKLRLLRYESVSLLFVWEPTCPNAAGSGDSIRKHGCPRSS